MLGVSRSNGLLLDTQHALQAHVRVHALQLSLSQKTTAWLLGMVSAQRPPILSMWYYYGYSCLQAAILATRHMAIDLLTNHAYTLSYIPMQSLLATLFGLYWRQV